MTGREKWKKNSHDVRKILAHIMAPVSNQYPGASVIVGKFGAAFHGRYHYWQIYNSINDTVIATVSVDSRLAKIRYRPNSWYAYIFEGYKPHNRVPIESRITEIRRVKSTNLNRHKGVVRNIVMENMAAYGNEVDNSTIFRTPRQPSLEFPTQFSAVTPSEQEPQGGLDGEYARFNQEWVATTLIFEENYANTRLGERDDSVQ